jgi:hypothetical protein
MSSTAGKTSTNSMMATVRMIASLKLRNAKYLPRQIGERHFYSEDVVALMMYRPNPSVGAICIASR